MSFYISDHRNFETFGKTDFEGDLTGDGYAISVPIKYETLATNMGKL
jgi:hypothetical protein